MYIYIYICIYICIYLYICRLRNTATHRNILQHTATHLNTHRSNIDAPHCNPLQNTATHRNTLQHTCNTHETHIQHMQHLQQIQQSVHFILHTICTTLHHTAAHMQQTASLQHTCNTLQQHTCNTCNRLSRTRTSSSTRSANGFSALDDVRVCVCVFGCPIGDVGVSRLTNEGNTVFDMEEGVVE